jgi:hypothetical protein
MYLGGGVFSGARAVAVATVMWGEVAGAVLGKGEGGWAATEAKEGDREVTGAMLHPLTFFQGPRGACGDGAGVVVRGAAGGFWEGQGSGNKTKVCNGEGRGMVSLGGGGVG